MTKDNNTRRADNFGEEQHDGRNTENGKNTEPDALIISRMTGLDLWRVELALTAGYSTERVKVAAEQLRDVRVWISRNIDAWGYILHGALFDATRGKRVSIARLVENARHLDFLDVDGNYSSYDNTNDSILARLLIETVPEAEPHIERRRSVYDFLIGGADVDR